MDEKQPESEAKDENATVHLTEAVEVTNMEVREVATEAENVEGSENLTETSPSPTDKHLIESGNNLVNTFRGKQLTIYLL